MLIYNAALLRKSPERIAPRRITKFGTSNFGQLPRIRSSLSNINNLVLLISFQLEGHLEPLNVVGSLAMAFEPANFRL